MDAAHMTFSATEEYPLGRRLIGFHTKSGLRNAAWTTETILSIAPIIDRSNCELAVESFSGLPSAADEPTLFNLGQEPLSMEITVQLRT